MILNEPKKPVNEVITTQDTTVEALASIVKKTNFPVAILTDELASYFKGLKCLLQLYEQVLFHRLLLISKYFLNH